MSKVTVVSIDPNGNVINVSKNNPEYGYVRVEQVSRVISESGWLRMSKRSALIKGLVKDLVEADLHDGQVLEGKIIVRESHQPFNPENPERDLKIAGDSGIICRVDDMPIYRQSFYTMDANAQDQLIMHTNSDEIRDAQRATKIMRSMTSQEDGKRTMSSATSFAELDQLL